LQILRGDELLPAALMGGRPFGRARVMPPVPFREGEWTRAGGTRARTARALHRRGAQTPRSAAPINVRPDQRARLLFRANLLRFRAFSGGGVGGNNYTASPSNTALHRSWMLAERAFGQLASV